LASTTGRRITVALIGARRAGPGRLLPCAVIRLEGQDLADGRLLADRFWQRKVSPDLVAVAAAVFLLAAEALGLFREISANPWRRSGPARRRAHDHVGPGCGAAAGEPSSAPDTALGERAA
jgi:hypothetical protein